MSFNNKQEFPSRYRQNRYEDNVKKVKQFITKVCDYIIIAILIIAIVLAYYPMYKAFATSEPTPEPVVEQVEEVKPEPKVVRIVAVPTQEDIINEIHRVFPDAPVMLSVAYCEGVVNGELSVDVVNPTNQSYDTGVFQISRKYHHKHYTKLGLDMTDYRDNIKFARILYDESGLQPWSASQHCWSK